MDEETTQDRESPAGCPSQAELVAFNRGRLPAQRTDSVAFHIGICQRCGAALRELSDDSDLLIASLRGSCTDELPFVQEPGCVHLEARARALFSGSSDARLKPPQRLGQYELVRRIKGGGMGDVHEARHVRLERRVALKTLRGDRMHDPRLIARFQREMAAVGKVDHANVVRASDAGDAEGWHFLVMDYIDGLDLAVIARRCGALPIADAAEIARQTALGLQSIHEHGLVHRDIKPSNLMLDVDGNVKILDLGLALLYEAPVPGDDLTETGVGMGTADYMSPEQALDSHQVKIQSDLYSLGCTLYKLLTGRAPFETPQYRTPLQKMQAHVQDLPPPVQTYLPNIPAGLGDIVHKLLEKKPDRRLATPNDLAQAIAPFATGCALQALLEHARALEAVIADEVEPATPRPTGAATRCARHARRWLTAAASVVFLAGLLVVWAVAFPPWIARPQPVGGPKDAPDVPHMPIAAPVLWPADFPEALRDRPMGKRIALIERGKPNEGPRPPHQGVAAQGADKEPFLLYQPTWSRRLAGTGLYYCHKYALTLDSSSFDANHGFTGFTALALDDDRAARWFEFDAELWPTRPAQVGQAQARGGVFFGWRPAEKEGQLGAYFVQLLDRLGPDDALPAGWVVVNHVTFPADPAEAGRDDAVLGALAVNPLAEVRLTQTSKRYAIHVRATQHNLTIAVGHGAPMPVLAPFDARGNLGVWVQKGSAWFTDVSVTSLAPPRAP